jgi:hypothetical protein
MVTPFSHIGWDMELIELQNRCQWKEDTTQIELQMYGSALVHCGNYK